MNANIRQILIVSGAPSGPHLTYPKAKWPQLCDAAHTHYNVTGKDPKKAYETETHWVIEVEGA